MNAVGPQLLFPCDILAVALRQKSNFKVILRELSALSMTLSPCYL